MFDTEAGDRVMGEQAVGQKVAVSPAGHEIEASFRPADPANAQTLSAEQVRFFNDNGYVAPLDVFDAEEALRNRNYIDGLLQKLQEEEDGRDNYALLGYHYRCAGLYDLVMTDRILDLVEDLIGPDILCWTSHLFCKIGRDPKSVPFHQDASYWEIAPTRTVSVWLAIDDATTSNSCLYVIPRTHQAGFLPWKEAEGDRVDILNQSLDCMERLPAPVPLELNAGQVSIHADLTAHGSEPNRGDQRRCGFVMRYCPPDVVPLERSWGTNAVLCRGTAATDGWTLQGRPEGDDVASWEAYYFEQARRRQSEGTDS